MIVLDWSAYLLALGVNLLIAAAAWTYSIPKRNVSIVDSLWSLMILSSLLATLGLSGPLTTRGAVVLTLASIWAVRLSAYITWRNHGEPEDRRYQAIRHRNEPGFWFKSLYLVFGLQAVLAWIISLPAAAAAAAATPLGWLDLLAIGVWLVGMGFETVGDWQLARFLRRRTGDQVLDQGLWRYTRHPNYFGEALLWWGFYLFAVAAGAWWTIIAPAFMTFLLLRVSGVALLEKDIADRRPAYRDYVQRTSAFLPLPPRRGPATRVE